MRIACVDADRLVCSLGNLFGRLGVAGNGRAKAKPRPPCVAGSGGLVPGPWLWLRLAGKGVRPGRLAQRLGKDCLRILVQALLSRQQPERGDQGGRQSNLPGRRLAQAKEVEEELYRPPFRHQIPLPIRRGEVESRRWQRHHASATTQRLARSAANTVGPPSRAASRPGRPTWNARRAEIRKSVWRSEVDCGTRSLKYGAWR